MENQSKIEEELVMLDNFVKMLYLIEPDRLVRGPGGVSTFIMLFWWQGYPKVSCWETSFRYVLLTPTP